MLRSSLAVMALCFAWAGTFSLSYGQRNASAAKGGSPVRELVRSDLESGTRSPESYRRASEYLGLDYDILLTKFTASKQTRHPTSFKNILLVYLIARDLAPEDFEKRSQRVLELIGDGNSLDKALRLSFLLPMGKLQKHKRIAERKLNSAPA